MILHQAARLLARDWRAGELGVLGAALAIAVASVSSVGFFAERVSRALLRDAHQLLGADLVLVSDHPWAAEVSTEIGRRGLASARALAFVSMLSAGELSQIAGVKAVSANYPLRGRLRIAPAPGAPDAPAAAGPAPGTVWLDERLVSALAAPVGSRMRLGAAAFEVAAVLTLEPERGANFFNLAPRVFMNVDDVPATGLVQPGSRVWYSLYAAGPRAAVDDFERWVRARLVRGQRVDNLESGRPEVRAAIERARRLLGLAALLAAILAGVAIALGARRFVERHLDGCAVMRCLGATQRRLVALYALEFAALGAIAAAAGCALGAIAQAGLVAALGDLVRAELPPPGLLPALHGFLAGLVLLLGFALPPLVQLAHVPALRVLRREIGPPARATRAVYASGLAAFLALLFWQADDLRLGLAVVLGFGAALAASSAIAWALLRIVASARFARAIGALAGGSALRYGLASLRRHARANAVQVASLALGVTVLLLLAFTRDDLVDAWRRSAPPDAPNRFVLGVQPDQLGAVREHFRAAGLEPPELYPMVRGRLVAVNGRPVSANDYAGERARAMVEREFNLSWVERLPAHNALAAGRWFAPDAHELSVEEGIARTLGWRIGDALSFRVGADSFTATITSVRRLRWDSMKVNFFVLAPPALLSGFPASYIAAFRVEPQEERFASSLVRRFPNLTVVDMGAALRQAQAVVDRVIAAVQVVFVFALGSGLLVLYAALLATEDERRREAALMRVCGASRALVMRIQRVEFLAIGLLAGLLAGAGAAAIGELLARYVFELDLPANPWLFVAGPLAGMALLALNGWLSARGVLRASPAETLREAG